MQPHHRAEFKKYVPLLVVLVLLIGLGYLFFYRGFQNEEEYPVVVAYTPTDAEKSPQEQLPPGFPIDFPLTDAQITKSYTVRYETPPATQSSITFKAAENYEGVHTRLVTYLQARDYTITSSQVTDTAASVYATKENVDFSILITDENGGADVQVGLVVKRLAQNDESANTQNNE